ncbi:MAG TPA: biotin--[acetyl-CoA-carboxylase] ligase [Bacteroidia bacterium]|nr:biotin--[acetyl-CoA-carboxylase] ligase [Bacteroidia bacterium]
MTGPQEPPNNSSGPLFIGHNIIRLSEVDSTNSYALGLIRGASMVAEGVVVTAFHQMQGRGQRGNAWHSSAGKNITCSIILRPTFLAATAQFDLTRAVALGVSDLLKVLLPANTVSIKWPNDIMISDAGMAKKAGGILIENVLNGSLVSAAVVGIGLNLNQTDFVGTAGAISLTQLTGRDYSLSHTMQEMFSAVEARYLQLRAGKLEKIREEYESRLYRKGIQARYTDFKTIFDGTITGVTAEGKLVVDCAGQKRLFGYKEIGFLG